MKEKFRLILIVQILMLGMGLFMFQSSVIYGLGGNQERWFSRLFLSIICLGFYSIIRLLKEKKQ